MPSQIKITIKNLKEIKSAFHKAPLKMTEELNRAIKTVILKIEGDAKKLAPVNKQSGGGNLRQSINSHMTGIASGLVEVGVNYAAAVHEGTRPHIIRISTKRVLANKRTGQIFGKVVHHPGTKANPFLKNAVEQNQSFIDEEFWKAVDKTLK